MKQTTQSDLVTKQYLDKRFIQERKYTQTYIDGKFDALMKYIDFKTEGIEELRSDFAGLKSDMFDKLDWLIGAYQRLDEERIVHAQHHEDINKTTDNHEIRIGQLENHTKVR